MEPSGRGGSVAATMRTECGECGHRLRAEVWSNGAFRFVVHFDNERGETHGERAPTCPGCGARLDLGMTPEEPGAIARGGVYPPPPRGAP